MAQSFPFVASIVSSNPDKPSNCCSGLTEQLKATSLVSVAPTDDVDVEVDRAAAREAKVASVGLPGPERKKRVIVVGAGISGLRAASVLQRHGLEVVVLEGRDRIGGRICTRRKENGVARDIGAAWMHETSQNRLVKLIPKLGIEYYYDDGTPLYYTRDGRAGPQFKAKKVADEFADYIEWYYRANPEAADKSVDEFIHEFVKQHELITDDERLWAPQAVREVEQWIGTSTSTASSKYLSYFVTERNLYMKGCYDTIVNWTAEPLRRDRDTIRLQHVVKQVNWSEDGSEPARVQCVTAAGEDVSITGDAIVVTIPLGALHHKLIAFSPPLPQDIQHGIDKLSYGALGKIFFQFSEIFWSKDNDQLIYLPSPHVDDDDDDDDDDEDTEVLSASSYGSSLSSSDIPDSILNYPSVTVNLALVADRKELCIQIAEPLTQRIEAMSDKKKIYKFFEPLFKLIRTEPYKALPRLVDLEMTQWTQDPLAGYGTYSAEKVGDNPHLIIKALENHRTSRLQFAGEHLIRLGNGCVHGAFATGETAAKRLLDSFGIPFDGGDFLSSN